MIRQVMACCVALLLVPVVTADDSEVERVEQGRYLGPWLLGGDRDEPVPGCDADQPLGGVCFELRPGDRLVRISAEDDFAPRVCVQVYYMNATGYVGTSFCGEGVIDVTWRMPDAHLLYVKVKPFPGILSQPPTQGTITAEFIAPDLS